MSCKKICIGDLKHKVEIIDKSQDGGGCEVSFLTPIRATVRAKIDTIDTQGGNSRLIFDDTNVGETVTHKFTIRFRNDIQADDLLMFNDRFFKIQGFKDPDELRKWLVIFVIERGDINNTRNQL